jgi:hypothetical protein
MVVIISLTHLSGGNLGISDDEKMNDQIVGVVVTPK